MESINLLPRILVNTDYRALLANNQRPWKPNTFSQCKFQNKYWKNHNVISKHFTDCGSGLLMAEDLSGQWRVGHLQLHSQIGCCFSLLKKQVYSLIHQFISSRKSKIKMPAKFFSPWKKPKPVSKGCDPSMKKSSSNNFRDNLSVTL